MSKATLLSVPSTPNPEPGVDLEVKVTAKAGPEVKAGDTLPVAPPPTPLDGASPFHETFYPETSKPLQVAAGPFAEGLKLLAKGVSPLAVDASREAVEKQAMMLTRQGFTGELPTHAFNINLSKIESPEEITSLVVDIADMLGKTRIDEATRGVMPDIEARERALAQFEQDEGFILRRNVGQAFNAEQIDATRLLLASTRDHVYQLEQRILSGDNNQTTLTQYLRAMSLASATQLQLHGMTAEAGRALRRFREPVSGGAFSGEQIDAMAVKITAEGQRAIQSQLDEVGGLDGILTMIEQSRALTTPAAKNKYIREATRPGAEAMLREIFYGSVLSGPGTHERNFLGNGITLTLSTAERPIAAAWGKAFGFVGRAQGIHAGETAAMVSAYWREVGNAWKLANFALRHNETVGAQTGYRLPLSTREIWKMTEQEVKGLTAGEIGPGSKLDTPRVPAVTGENVGALAKNAGKAVGLKRTRKAADPNQTGERGALGRTTDFLSLMVDGFGGVVRAPSRALGAADQFFRTLAFHGEAYSQLYREGVAAGKSGKELREYVDQGVYFLTPAQEHAAEAFARTVTMTERLQSEWPKRFAGLAQAPGGFLIAPFVRVASNLLDFATQRVAFPVRPVWYSEIRSADPAVRDLAMAKATTGALMWATAYQLAASPWTDDTDEPIVVTGSPPTDPNLKRIWEARGYKPGSIRLGGKGGEWVQYSRLDPGGQMLGIATDTINILEQMDDVTAEEFAAALVAGVGSNLVNKSYLSSSVDAMAVFSSYDTQEYAKWLKRQGAVIVPNLVAQLVAEQDPYLRKTVSTAEEIVKRSSVEGRKALPKYRDIAGRPIKTEQRFGVSVADDKPDPVADELWRLQMSFGPPDKIVRGVELDEHQYDRLQQLAGYALKGPKGREFGGVTPRGERDQIKIKLEGLGMWEALGALIKAKGYDKATDGADPPGQKVAMINRIKSIYLEEAEARLLGEFPELADKSAVAAGQVESARGATPDETTGVENSVRTGLRELATQAMSYEVVE